MTAAGEVRRVEVAPERLTGWVERFAASHGQVRWATETDPPGMPRTWLGRAADGSWARLEGWGAPGAELDLAPRSAWMTPPGPVLVVLVRRGGYAVAVATVDGQLAAHKVGSRRVQGRTAAGGWSQQRFARRRANQADELVGAAVGHARRILDEAERTLGGRVAALVLGGDPALGAQALTGLATGELTRLTDLPRRDLPDLADPRRSVLDDAVRRALAVRVEVLNA